MIAKKCLAVSLLVMTLVLISPITYPARASTAPIPIKVAVLIDGEYAVSSIDSDLFRNVKHVLDVNRIPFDVCDTSQVASGTFMDGARPRYAALLMMNAGYKFDTDKTRLVAEAVREGMGLVALLADAVNDDFLPVFGMKEKGEQWLSADGLVFLKDKFTFTYQGQTLPGSLIYLGHSLLAGADTVATFTGANRPAIWTYRYGEGKIVFHNHTLASLNPYRGVLLQSILFAMPVGVSLPAAAGAIEVDDYPCVVSSSRDDLQRYKSFGQNFNELLKAYNLQSTFFLTFSYSGNIDDFWLGPPSLESAREIVEKGYELGLHSGTKHVPLDPAAWGGKTGVDMEVERMTRAVQFLKNQLLSTYGVRMPDIVSYAAPANWISGYGYEALSKQTGIRYVGVANSPATAAYEGSDRLAYATYPITYRDFGRESGTNIYDLPRLQGGFYKFNQPGDKDYATIWNNLRSTVESGEAYVIFTVPDERDILGQSISGDLKDTFQAYKVWADYVTARYPFYRWLTSAQLGQYLEQRDGPLDAGWSPDDSTLSVKLARADDVVQIKTDRYLSRLSVSGDRLVARFSDTPAKIDPGRFDVVQVGHDYFIYSRDSPLRRPVVGSPFTFRPAILPTPKPEVPVMVNRDLIPPPYTPAAAARPPLKIGPFPWKAALGLALAGLLFLMGLLMVAGSRRGPRSR